MVELLPMKHLQEYRDGDIADAVARSIHETTTRSWSIMEVCGGQTHSIMRYGIDQMIPSTIQLIHGPGCPVCVTPVQTIDRAQMIAEQPKVILCTYGDMLRVPGSRGSLSGLKTRGCDIRTIYSPLQACQIARDNPNRSVVLFAIGFETTAPANAMAIKIAKTEKLKNFSVLVSHVLVPPAIEMIASDPACRVDAFLAAGHVCAVTGYEAYHRLSETYRIPIVVTGFEPVDLLEGIRLAVLQLEKGQAFVENAYQRTVAAEGNPMAQGVLQEVFQVTDREWRGIGTIPQSGYCLSEAFRDFDAEVRFPLERKPVECTNCRAGDVLRGILKPNQCEEFGKGCTPDSPLGAPMVSHEGACAAYYQFSRLIPKANAPQ